jgi:hypothetical protein
MSELPFFYNRVSPTTWVHLSSILTISLFFKFSRFWSVRNLDLIALILVAPGLFAAQYGHATGAVRFEQAGYIWLFVSGLWFLVRMLVDPTMVRRPLLEPNLSAGGMAFLGIAMFVFLSANVLTGNPEMPDSDKAASVAAATTPVPAHPAPVTPPDSPFVSIRAVEVKAPTPKDEPAGASGSAADQSTASADAIRLARQGPGYPLLFRIPNIITQDMSLRGPSAHGAASKGGETMHPPVDLLSTRILLVLLHLAVVIGLVLIGYRHFDNIKTGIAAAVLYLMLPYTAEVTGYLRHVLPAAPLVWAIVVYRRPVLAGMLIGLAMGLAYYPLFLLPLWLSFYWQRGLLRFLSGLLPMLAALAALLLLWAPGREAFFTDLGQMFGWAIPQMAKENFEGFWRLNLLDPVYRIPVLVAFVALSVTMAIWPAQKNLGTLMSCSAAVMVACQFWNAHFGALYIGWYLPLLLLTIFRPNLEDRVALSVLGEGWLPKRRTHLKRIERAA